tara:strand:+ start:724 stop:1467 length:744 start_codon:yes stop_codon:yes gene_type:complete
MFPIEFLFITITLIILCVVSFKIGTPKVILPLAVIYCIVLINEVFNFSNERNNVVNINTNDSLSTLDNDDQNAIIEKIVFTDNPSIDSLEKIDLIKIEKKESNPTKLIQIEKPKVEKPKVEKPKVEKPKVEKETYQNLLSVIDIKICKNIKNRNPVGVKNVFPNTVDSLYCFTKIQNLGSKKEVRHIWFYENQVMTQVRYNVKKSNTYRSWTKKTISSFQVGNWRVEVQDKHGTIIGSKRFKIKKSS